MEDIKKKLPKDFMSNPKHLRNSFKHTAQNKSKTNKLKQTK